MAAKVTLSNMEKNGHQPFLNNLDIGLKENHSGICSHVLFGTDIRSGYSGTMNPGLPSPQGRLRKPEAHIETNP